MSRIAMLLITVLVILPTPSSSETEPLTERCKEFNLALVELTKHSGRLVGLTCREVLFANGLTVDKVDKMMAESEIQATVQTVWRLTGEPFEKAMEHMAKLFDCPILPLDYMYQANTD